MAQLHLNNPAHYADFIRLNEQWITQHFQIETADRALAANPGAVIDKGGCILSLCEQRQVIGVCALFKQADGVYELARLAVDESWRGKGHGDRLVREALSILDRLAAHKVTLMSNTQLAPALALYRKHGFEITFQGPHPVYARTNIVMEKNLQAGNNV